MSNVSQMLTTAEVAEALGISSRRVTRLVQRGWLEPADRGVGDTGPFRFNRDAVGRLAATGIPDRRKSKWKRDQ